MVRRALSDPIWENLSRSRMLFLLTPSFILKKVHPRIIYTTKPNFSEQLRGKRLERPAEPFFQTREFL